MTRLFETNRNNIFEYHIVQLCAITKNTKKNNYPVPNMFSYLMNLLFLIYFCYLII